MAHVVASPARTLTGTIIAVCPHERLAETRTVLASLHERTAMRVMVVTLGDHASPPIDDAQDAAVIDGLTPKYLNNLVAARRLSSLPALAWWRGGDASVLADLAPLVDRVVLDSVDPRSDWQTALGLLDLAAFADLRWTRLTRWRNLMSHFFDLPAVREGAGQFTHLEIDASDRHTARLFAAWLTDALPSGSSLDVRLADSGHTHALDRIVLSGGRHRLELDVSARGTCLRTAVASAAEPTVSHVSLGDQSHAALLDEELRIRARDVVFETALRRVAEAV